MKRYRVKALGLGMALWAGSLHGQQGPPDVSPPATLPHSVRTDEWAAATAASETLWLPVRSTSNPTSKPAPVASAPAGPIVIPPVVSNVAPNAPSEHVKPASSPGLAESPMGPRLTGPLPLVGPAPEVPLPAATIVAVPPPIAAPTPPAAFPLPTAGIPLPEAPSIPATPAIPATRMTPTIETTLPVTQPLPKPREVPPPPIPPAKTIPETPKLERELPTAPPELMVPQGEPVPGKHGTFGSAGVRISKDYPSVREMMDHDGSGWWDGFLGGLQSANADPTTMASDRLEVNAEYLMWWMNNQRIPVLATTSLNGGFGFLGDPGTATLLGPGNFGNSLRNGMRLRAGYWGNDCGAWGIGGSFFFLGRQSTNRTFDSSNIPTITRPIFAPNFPGEFGEIVAMPGLSAGTFRVNSTSTLWGFDANVRRALCKTCDFRSEVFVGYRFLALNESLTMNESVTALPGNTSDPAGTRVTVSDSLQTKNRFNGGQVGYAAERIWGRLSVDGRASIALGDTSQSLDITGFQSRLRPGMTTPDVFRGGLLATGPNLGHFQRDRFSVVPELTLNVGYWLTPVIKAYVGYNMIYWSNVIRPGDQIDRTVDVTFVPNPPPGVPFSGLNRPQPTFHQADLFVNGIQFGLMGRW